MSIDDVINEYYKEPEKLTKENLEEIVGEELQEAMQKLFGNILTERANTPDIGQRAYKMVLGQFKPPTEKAGELGTEERLRFQKYIANNIKGKSLGEKIKAINDIASGQFVANTASISEILSSLGAVKILQQTIDDFNPSTAGFIFEAFLAGLLQGKQVTDTVGGSLPIEDAMFFVDPKTGEGGQPISLKLLNPNTPIHGSLPNLLSFFARPDIAAVANKKGIEYIVAVKRREGELDIYSFTIYPHNFFEWISPKYFNFRGILEEEKDTGEENREKITNNLKRWESEVKKYAPAFGFDLPKDYRFNYWNLSSVNSTVKSLFSLRGRQNKKIEIMMSPQGQKAWEFWKKSSWTPEETKKLEIPDQATERELAGILKARQAAFSKILNAGSESGWISFVHVRRYYNMIAGKSAGYYARNIPDQITDLSNSNNAEEIIRWAKLLGRALSYKQNQFSLTSAEVQSRGHVYGTIRITEKQVQKSLNIYADLLKEKVLPIYESLNLLTENINGYFIENDPAGAFKAADEAGKLKQYSEELTDEVKIE